jgi:hypothetical protein
MACNRPSLLLLLLGLVSLLSAVPVQGQELFIYPSKGQSTEQQSRDRYECHSWAVQQTGFDPTVSQAQASPPPPPAQGGVVRGGARGAAVGAVGGAITGNAGKGAAVGAAAGGLLGGMKQADQNASRQQAQAQSASQQAAARDAYTRALRACLTGRGYTIQ